MARLDQLERALINADKAGDADAARQLAAEIQRMRAPAAPAQSAPAAAPAPAEPGFFEDIGKTAKDVGRQVGLFARHAPVGLARMAEIGTEPIRQVIVNPIARLIGAPEAAPLGESVNRAATALGLPEPQNELERVVGEGTQMMAGGAGMAGGAQKLSQVSTGAARNVLQSLAARPGAQSVSAATAGLSGGAAKEGGASPGWQALASLAGGIGGGVAANKLQDIATAGGQSLMRMLRPAPVTQAVDQTISTILERSGIDWSRVPERVRQGMRQDAAEALRTGQDLDPAALRRLLAFRSTGTTPTVGMLTQNPGQITRERNLAKAGAASTDPRLQQLADVQNRNVQSLLQRLDEAGAAGAPNEAAAGQTSIGGLLTQAERARGDINSLYAAARDTAGRSLDLDRAAFTRQANAALDEAMVGSALPPDVANTMNRIARGEMPFTVEISEQLKTRIGALQRATNDGTARTALGVVRDALDNTPLMPSAPINPGNLPVVPGSIPPSAQTIGQESIAAFNKARAANRAYMNELRANPALAKVDEAILSVRDNPQLGTVADVVGAEGFMKKFVMSPTASPRQVEGLLQRVGPEGASAIRNNVLSQLKAAATRNTDDIVKWNDASYRDALRNIGERKLQILFSPEEREMLRNIGEAGKYMKAQPEGSAINNSNTAAAVIGQGLAALESAASFVPFGGREILTTRLQGMQLRQSQSPVNALALGSPRRPSSNAILPLLAGTAATPAPAREDERR